MTENSEVHPEPCGKLTRTQLCPPVDHVDGTATAASDGTATAPIEVVGSVRAIISGRGAGVTDAETALTEWCFRCFATS